MTEGGVNTIAVREFASRSGTERDAAMANMLSIRLLLSAAGMVATVGFAITVGYGQAIVIGTAVAGVGLSLQLIQELISVPLQSRMRFGWVAAADLVRNAVNTSLIVVLVLAGAGIVPLLAVSTPACLTALLLTTRLVRRSIPLRPTRRFVAYAPLLRETLPFAVAVALSSIYFRATVIVMSLEGTGWKPGISRRRFVSSKL